jgi:predicted lipid-binding transport protein (Tim44 family)
MLLTHRRPAGDRLFGRALRSVGLSLLAMAAIVVALPSADARPGGGKSFGSRGERTFQAPPSTNTAPKAAQPMERSITQPGAPTAAASQAAKGAAVAGAAQAAKPSLMRNLLLGGLIGAGLATIFGAGAFANVMGFLLQAAVIGGLIYLAIMLFRRRAGGPATAAATAGAGAASVRPTDTQANYRQAMGGLGGGVAPTLEIGPNDYSAFERLLAEVQNTYGRGDVKGLEPLTTPEMLSYFAQDLDANAKRGVRNELAGAKLLQGDLSEAWREGSGEYATVAMRYELFDRTVDIKTGRVVDGNSDEAQVVTEVWTFRRPLNGTPSQWELSAIQQA